MDVMIEVCDKPYSSITLSYGEYTHGSREDDGNEVDFDPMPYRDAVLAAVDRLGAAVAGAAMIRDYGAVDGSRVEISREDDGYVVDVILYKPTPKRERSPRSVYVTLMLDSAPGCGVGNFPLPESISAVVYEIDALVPRE